MGRLTFEYLVHHPGPIRINQALPRQRRIQGNQGLQDLPVKIHDDHQMPGPKQTHTRQDQFISLIFPGIPKIVSSQHQSRTIQKQYKTYW